jgi:DNA repair exonuclease SbcCD ATPase subunit
MADDSGEMMKTQLARLQQEFDRTKLRAGEAEEELRAEQQQFEKQMKSMVDELHTTKQQRAEARRELAALKNQLQKDTSVYEDESKSLKEKMDALLSRAQSAEETLAKEKSSMLDAQQKKVRAQEEKHKAALAAAVANAVKEVKMQMREEQKHSGEAEQVDRQGQGRLTTKGKRQSGVSIGGDESGAVESGLGGTHLDSARVAVVREEIYSLRSRADELECSLNPISGSQAGTLCTSLLSNLKLQVHAA